jgi:hypothetical protein
MLYHRDISEDNILIDNVGRAIALLGWEQLYTAPVSLIAPYPAIISPSPSSGETSHLSQWRGWKGEREKPEWRSADEERYERTLMRRAFRERLEALGSPWLETFKEKNEELRELMALVQTGLYTGIGKETDELVARIQAMESAVTPTAVEEAGMSDESQEA